MSTDRYVYVEAEGGGLLPASKGLRAWDDAIADRSVQLYGEPALTQALPTWFLSGDRGTSRATLA